MALKKRGKTWHCHFAVDGVRYWQSLGTTDWRDAQNKGKDRIAEAKAGKLAASSDNFTRLLFRDVAKRFLEDRPPHLAPRRAKRRVTTQTTTEAPQTRCWGCRKLLIIWWS
ncbi:MAG: hypothetical protein WCA10_13335 [Terracidiphilus sp.]